MCFLDKLIMVNAKSPRERGLYIIINFIILQEYLYLHSYNQ